MKMASSQCHTSLDLGTQVLEPAQDARSRQITVLHVVCGRYPYRWYWSSRFQRLSQSEFARSGLGWHTDLYLPFLQGLSE